MSIHFRNPLPVKKYDRENKLYIANSTSLDGFKTEYTDKSYACFRDAPKKCKMKCISRCKMDVFERKIDDGILIAWMYTDTSYILRTETILN